MRLKGGQRLAAFFACSLALGALYFILPAEWLNGKAGFRLPDVRFMGFLAGVGVAMFYDTGAFRRSQRAIAILGLGGLLLCLLLSGYVWGYHHALVAQQPFNNLYYLAGDLGFALICLAAIAAPSRWNVIRRCFELKPLRVLGIVSYSFYLSHAIIGIPLANRIAEQLGGLRSNYAFAFALSAGVCALTAMFLFHYLEKPYFKRRAAQRLAPAAAAQTLGG